jgi:hypothetical protein
VHFSKQGASADFDNLIGEKQGDFRPAAAATDPLVVCRFARLGVREAAPDEILAASACPSAAARDDPRHLEQAGVLVEQAGVLVGVGCVRQHVGDIEAGTELAGPFRRVERYDIWSRCWTPAGAATSVYSRREDGFQDCRDPRDR